MQKCSSELTGTALGSLRRCALAYDWTDRSPIALPSEYHKHRATEEAKRLKSAVAEPRRGFSWVAADHAFDVTRGWRLFQDETVVVQVFRV